MQKMFMNPAGALSSLRNLFRAVGAHDQKTRTLHAACAIARLNGLLWTMGFFTMLIGIYLGCCWPCTNIFALLMRFCCCCFGLDGIHWRRERRKARRKHYGLDSDTDSDTESKKPLFRKAKQASRRLVKQPSKIVTSVEVAEVVKPKAPSGKKEKNTVRHSSDHGRASTVVMSPASVKGVCMDNSGSSHSRSRSRSSTHTSIARVSDSHVGSLHGPAIDF
jgi:hypothetical protein